MKEIALRVKCVILMLIMVNLFYFVIPLNSEVGHQDNDGFIPDKALKDSFKPSISSELGESSARSDVESDVSGGSWLDSFNDESGIEQSMSDGLIVTNGDVTVDKNLQRPHSADANTVALWHMNETSGITVHDSSPSNNNGTFSNSPLWATAKFDMGLYFAGGGQFENKDGVRVPHSESLNLTDNFTIEAWIIADGSQDYYCIVDKYYYNETLTRAFGFTFYLVDGVLRLALYFGMDGSHHVHGESDLRDNEWHYVVGTFDGSYGRVYVDGVLESEDLVNFNPAPTTEDLGIGLRLGGWGGYMPFFGKMDELRISNIPRYPTFNTANLTSKLIVLPAKQNWDTMVIHKTHPADSVLNISILDTQSGQPIPGSPTHIKDDEYDISYIDPEMFPSIRLKAYFEGTSWHKNASIHYWGVSWNKSNVWRDTFFAGGKIDYIADDRIVVVDGDAVFENSGNIISNPIKHPGGNEAFSINYWGTLTINTTMPSGTGFSVDVLDINNDPIPGFDDLTDMTIDLRSIDTVDYPEIKLKIVYYTSGVSGTLHDWSVSVTRNTQPVIENVAAEPSVVNRTESAQISINLSDDEESEQDLSLQVQYKSPTDDEWQDEYLSDPEYITDRWVVVFSPPADAEIGSYSFRFNCADSFNDFDSEIVADFIEVINNLPVISEIQISSFKSSMNRTYSLDIFVNTSDVEIQADKLDIEINYRIPFTMIWSSEYISDIVFDGSNWTATFTPPKDAHVGFYIFNITCNDTIDEVMETIDILVLNNFPSKPTVTIFPENPNATDDLTVSVRGSEDIETPSEELENWYRWYRDGTYLPAFDNATIITNNSISDGENWTCIVYTYDGIDLGSPGLAGVDIYDPAIGDLDGDKLPDKLDDFPRDRSAGTDSDGDGYPDEWNIGMNGNDSTTGLSLDAFPDDPAASSDTDGDGSPDAWNIGMTEANSTTGLKLDAFPTDPAASIDTDGDGYPDKWNEGKTEDDSTTGLKKDSYPLDPDKHEIIETEEQGYLLYIILIIIAVIILTLVVYRSKTQRKIIDESFYDKEKLFEIQKPDLMVLEVKWDVIHGKSPRISDLKSPGARRQLDAKLKSGEISLDTYNYISCMINDIEEDYHVQKMIESSKRVDDK